jgi:hypothetical protein
MRPVSRYSVIFFAVDVADPVEVGELLDASCDRSTRAAAIASAARS